MILQIAVALVFYAICVIIGVTAAERLINLYADKVGTERFLDESGFRGSLKAFYHALRLFPVYRIIYFLLSAAILLWLYVIYHYKEFIK